jgi:hypothetical protein
MGGWEVQARMEEMEQREGGGMILGSHRPESTATLRKQALGSGTEELVSKVGSGDGVVSVSMTFTNTSCMGRGEEWVEKVAMVGKGGLEEEEDRVHILSYMTEKDLGMYWEGMAEKERTGKEELVVRVAGTETLLQWSAVVTGTCSCQCIAGNEPDVGGLEGVAVGKTAFGVETNNL